MIKLQSGERQTVTQYIHSVCGITLDASKDYLIENRLSHVLTDLACTSFTDLISRSRRDATGALQRRIVNEITTGETLFFRDSAPFDLLRHKIIPEIIDRRSRPGLAVPIRIWSAACSTGQEVYSIAMTLKDVLGDSGRYQIRLIGTDISDQAIARASEGVFSEIEISRGLPDSFREKYFTRHARGWKVRDEIRALAAFRKMNLFDDLSGLGKFDVVFCRNVAIYFNESDKANLFHRIGQRMESDACLVVGSMESLTAVSPQFEAKRHLRCVYYQLQGGSRPGGKP